MHMTDNTHFPRFCIPVCCAEMPDLLIFTAASSEHISLQNPIIRHVHNPTVTAIRFDAARFLA
jgi:hypothetical protein